MSGVMRPAFQRLMSIQTRASMRQMSGAPNQLEGGRKPHVSLNFKTVKASSIVTDTNLAIDLFIYPTMHYLPNKDLSGFEIRCEVILCECGRCDVLSCHL